MKTWMWLALAGGVAYWLYTSGKLQQMLPQGTPEPYTPPQGPQHDYYGQEFVPLPDSSQPVPGDDQFRDVGADLVTQLYGYSVAPRADQVHYRGSH